MDQHIFAERRRQFMAKMKPNSIAIIPTAPHYERNNDTHFLFRANSDFFYLTGFNEPEALLIIKPNRAEGDYILFNRVRDPLMEVWYGHRAGQRGAVNEYGAKQAFLIDDFSQELPSLLEGCEWIYFPLGRDQKLDHAITTSVNQLRGKVRGGMLAPLQFINSELITHEMRLYKSTEEIIVMRKSAQIAANAHVRAMKACRPGVMEYEIEAELLYEFRKQGSYYPAYPPIVAGGVNTCILHYHENNRRLNAGDLLLVDAGCEYDYYASDITRTYPVNGKFSREQQAIYELVLAAQVAGIQAAQVGASFNQGQENTIQLLTQGLIDLGILNGELTELIETNAYKPYYMHRLSHWIGMDVHDAGFYSTSQDWRMLETGMALTIEPGLYLSPGDRKLDEKWWGIGIRIEDDIVITENGADVLSSDAPKTVSEIEALMKH